MSRLDIRRRPARLRHTRDTSARVACRRSGRRKRRSRQGRSGPQARGAGAGPPTGGASGGADGPRTARRDRVAGLRVAGVRVAGLGVANLGVAGVNYFEVENTHHEPFLVTTSKLLTRGRTCV